MRCKPNQLCYINKSFFPENIGSIVTTLECYMLSCPIYGKDIVFWKVLSKGLKTFTISTNETNFSTEGHIPDYCLTPISDPDLDTSDSETTNLILEEQT